VNGLCLSVLVDHSRFWRVHWTRMGPKLVGFLPRIPFIQSTTHSEKGESVTEFNKEEILCPRDVAQLLGVSVPSITHLARCGKLPAFRVGKLWRFRRSELSNTLSSQAQLKMNADQNGRKP
jgi:excisionase family DNA binding protein